MSAMQTGLQVLALAAAGSALIVGVAALMARSLFAMCMYLAAFGALAACATLALGGGDAALAVALLAGALAPGCVLAAIVLSARAAKARRGVPWLSRSVCGVAGDRRCAGRRCACGERSGVLASAGDARGGGRVRGNAWVWRARRV